jgi:hypothetical protein
MESNEESTQDKDQKITTAVEDTKLAVINDSGNNGGQASDGSGNNERAMLS